MKTKRFYGVDFNVYTDKIIDGDFIHPEEAVYFENDVEITGNLKVKYLKCEKSISVYKSYVVEKWEEIGGYQEVGEYQKVGGYQKVSEYQKVNSYQEIGGCQEVGGCQEIGWYQEVGGHQEVGGCQEVCLYQNIGRYQKVGGSLVAASSRVSLYSIVKGEYKVKGKIFIGVCEWKDTTEEEETLTCGKFVSGKLMYGKLKEIGLPDNNKQNK